MSAQSEMSNKNGKVKVTFQNDVAIMVMDCGENRFSNGFIQKLHSAFDEVLRNPKAKAVVTTGEVDDNGAYFTSVTFRRLLFRILTFPLPTVALLNGHAFAGGAMLSLTFDHMIMNDARGWWCLNEIHLKRIFRKYMIALMKAKIPNDRTFQESVVLGRRFTAPEALAAGIVHQTCSANDMLPRAMEWIQKIVPPKGYDRITLQTMKEDVYEDVLNTKDTTNVSKL